MTISLKGKTGLITGASSGIGRATAVRLAAEGMRLALVARSRDKLDALAVELPTEAIPLPGDLAVAAEVDRAMAEAIKRLGHLDVLFANAGIYVPGIAAEGDPDAWDKMIAINVSGVFRAIRAVLPHMMERRSGDIIVTSSISGHQAIHWEPVYSATKHTVQSFVHGVRRQVSADGIRVGSIAPGTVLNELWGYTDPDQIAAKVAERAGLTSEDVAEAVVFMLTRPANVTVRDLVMLPQNQDI
jgi:ribitol 2-dehydrogenase